MIIHKINPVLLKIGSIDIKYYGLFYILGAILTFLFLKYFIKKRKIDLSKNDVFDLTVYLLLGVFLGARIFYFIFYNFNLLIKNPLELFVLWHGGMSLHGGLIGAVIACFIFCKIKNTDFYQIADLAVIPISFALVLGRIGNFINGEIYGKIYKGFLCINYEQNPHLNFLPKFCRFPVQFLESLKNFFIFSVLFFLENKKFPHGFLFWLFITLYGLLRFLVEFLRHQQEALILTYFSRAQLLSFIMIIVGGIMLFRKIKEVGQK